MENKLKKITAAPLNAIETQKSQSSYETFRCINIEVK